MIVGLRLCETGPFELESSRNQIVQNSSCGVVGGQYFRGPFFTNRVVRLRRGQIGKSQLTAQFQPQ
jgi:hypothetical protein